jgi:hypothetical protein
VWRMFPLHPGAYSILLLEVRIRYCSLITPVRIRYCSLHYQSVVLRDFNIVIWWSITPHTHSVILSSEEC